MQREQEAGSMTVQKTEECRLLVACREGNWVRCNNHLHFFGVHHSFLWNQQWNLETLQWHYRGHSKQQSAKSLSFALLESACSPQSAYIFLIPCLQIVLAVFRTPLHGTRPGLLHLTKPNSWSSYFILFFLMINEMPSFPSLLFLMAL